MTEQQNQQGEAIQEPDTVEPEMVDSEIEDLKNKILRLQADFDNFRKRTSRARGDAADEARRDTASAFLPVYDHFVRALEQAESAPELLPFLSGFEMIRQQLEQTFGQIGLERIPADAGTQFDPNVHDANGMIDPAEGAESGTIAQELLTGFTYKGLVVRPSRVLVYS